VITENKKTYHNLKHNLTVELESDTIYKIFAKTSTGHRILVGAEPSQTKAEETRDNFIIKNQHIQSWLNSDGIVETEIVPVKLIKGSE
jgi:hypothetical protein